MFEKLTDFAYTRSTKQAIGFYIVWLLVLIVISGSLALSYEIVAADPGKTFAEGYAVGIRIGSIFAFIASAFFVVRVAMAKKRFSDSKMILYVLGTLVLVIIGGGLLGLIIPAYLTTLPVKTGSEPLPS